MLAVGFASERAMAQGTHVRLVDSGSYLTEQYFALALNASGDIAAEQGPFEIFPKAFGPQYGCVTLLMQCRVSPDADSDGLAVIEANWPELINSAVPYDQTNNALASGYGMNVPTNHVSFMPPWLLAEEASAVTNASTAIFHHGHQFGTASYQEEFTANLAEQVWTYSSTWNASSAWKLSTLSTISFDAAYIAKAAIARQINHARSWSISPTHSYVHEAFMTAATSNHLELRIQAMVMTDPFATPGTGLPSLPTLPQATLSEPLIVRIQPPGSTPPNWIWKVSDPTVTPVPGNPGRPYYWPTFAGLASFKFELDADWAPDMVAYFSGASSTPVTLQPDIGNPRRVTVQLPSGAATGPFVVMQGSNFVPIRSPESAQMPGTYVYCAYGELVILG